MDGQGSSQAQSGQSAPPADTTSTETAGNSAHVTTLAGGAGSGDNLTEAKPGQTTIGGNGGPDWRAMLAGEDAKAVEQLSRYDSPSAFLQAHNELRGKLSQRAEPLKVDENSTPEQISAYRKSADVPEVAEDAKDEAYAEAYGLKLPEGVDVPPALLGAFARQMNAAHVSKGVAQKVVGEFAKIQLEVEKRGSQLNVEKGREWKNGLIEKWGAKEYGGRIAAAKGWLQDRFKDNPDGLSRIAAYQAPDGGLLGDDPFFIELFSEKGMGAGYTDIIQANTFEAGGRSIMEQIREIEALQRSDRKAYNEAQPKLLQLYQAGMTRGLIDENGQEVANRRRA